MELIVVAIVIYIAWGLGNMFYDEATKKREAAPAAPRPSTPYVPPTSEELAEEATVKFEEKKRCILRSVLSDLEKEAMLTEAEIEYAEALRRALR